MILATAGWGVLWTSLLLHKSAGWGPAFGVTYTIAAVPAALGVLYALMSIRAKRSWLFMAGVALFANGSLLAVPWLFDAEVRAVIDAGRDVD